MVAYVQGGQPEGALAGYFGRGQARGRARGRLAGLVGLRGEVTGAGLERLLRGRHAVTGQPLLSGPGPAASRMSHAAGAGRQTVAEGAEWLTLGQAAEIVGVTAGYLRRLVSRTAQAGAAVSGDQTDDRAAGVDRDPGEQLAGARGSDGWWRVRRADLERWNASRVPPATVLGYDVVCAAPKSVSLLWAFGDEALRADVGAALDAAVEATIGYLERHATFGLVAGRNRHSLGLAVASYLHDVSRNAEAHLHVHNIVINAVAVPTDGQPPDGGVVAGWDWRAIDGEVLLAHVRTAGFVGAAVLRRELSLRRGLAWEPVRNGVAELAGFPAGLLAAFSTRHGEVEAEFAQLVAQGFEPSGATKAAAQRGSRKAKKVLADDVVHAAQRETLTGAGYTVEQVRQLAPPIPARPAPFSAPEVADLFDLLAGPVGLTEKTSTFLRRDVVRAVAEWAGERADADTIEELTDRFLAEPRVVLIHGAAPGARRRHQPELVFTTEDLLAAEESLSALIRDGQVTDGAPPRLLVDPAYLAARLAVAARSPQSAGPGTGPPGAGAVAAKGGGGVVVLSREQAELVRRLLSGGDLVRPAVGPAGTGKTEAMRVLTGLLHGAGRRVFATAHGGRQAEELADRIGIPARVIASWLTLLDHTDDPTTVWPAGSVLIVDEATQVATRDAERLMRCATRTGTVVIVLGDPAQLGSVGAGGWFTHLVARTPDVPTLTTVHRQAGADLAPVRAALGALRADTAPTARAALERLAADGRIHLADSADTLLERAVADWYAERQRRARAAASGPGGVSARSARAATGASRSAAGSPIGSTGSALGPTGSTGSAAGSLTGSTGSALGSIGSTAGSTGLAEERLGSATGSTEAGGASTNGSADGVTGAQDGGTPGPAVRPQPVKVHLMAERHREVETLNRAARALLVADGALTGPVLTVAGREFQVGDEVITLTQAGHTLVPDGKPRSAYVRTGTIGVVTAVHVDPDNPAGQALSVYFPSKGMVHVPWEYLTYRFDDGRDGGLAHAYAITAAKAQGTTMDTARAVVPDDTSRAGLYVMLSRARADVAAYLVARDQLDERDDDETWLPTEPSPDGPVGQLADRLRRSRPEQQAGEQDPLAAAAHRLRTQHSLAELAALRLGQPAPTQSDAAPAPGAARHAPGVRANGSSSGANGAPAARGRADRTGTNNTSNTHGPWAAPNATSIRPGTPKTGPNASDIQAEPRSVVGAPHQVVLRRAELAAEAALRAAALTNPPAALVARIGPRPATGPDRAAWDELVGGLAIYHARRRPAAPLHEVGPPPLAAPHHQPQDPWLTCREQAVRLADSWTAALPRALRDRFDGAGQALPRERAIAGLHALLDAGRHPDELRDLLAEIPLDGVRAGAAVLEHRVTDLCKVTGLDPALYDLPASRTAQQEWNDLFRLVRAAEINHLATQPTGDLAAERRSLALALSRPGKAQRSTIPTGPKQPDTGAGELASSRSEGRERLDLVEAALNRQTTDALLHAKAEPAGYLTALLGRRPEAGLQIHGWDEAASRVEHYRHHVLGLPYGTPAQPGSADPTHHALGDCPTDPSDAAAYEHARDIAGLRNGQLEL